jgi:UDP-glucose 4-epimerase
VRILVTGAAGFIGSTLCDFLLTQDVQVAGLDNFSSGQREFLKSALQNKSFQLHEVDLTDFEKTKAIFLSFKPEIVVHLAANADVRFGLQHPRKDVEQGTLVTFNVLESARLAGTKKFAFSSTGSVYGEPKVFPTPENAPFPIQTSLYAASKLAGEALIQAYAEGYGIKAYIFRFVSILGERYTHGHIYDFLNKIKENPQEIEVLGDGKQRKAYLYIGDCISAIWHVLHHAEEKVNIVNLGPDEYIEVNASLDVICSLVDAKKLKSMGWKAQKTIKQSVELTVKYLLENDWVLNRRKTE